jgi:hypothetical protein
MSTMSAARAGKSARAAFHFIPAAQRRVAATVVIAIAADQLFDPTSTHVPLCPLHALTGIWCPFCGGLRSAFELTRFHFRAAAQYNLLLVLAAPVVLALWVDSLTRARAGRAERKWPRAVPIAIIVALIAFTIGRNLPFATVLRGGG